MRVATFLGSGLLRNDVWRSPSDEETNPMKSALEGIRVLDCTMAMDGPYAALQLRNLGAEVIKIEPPEGDIVRQWGPFVGPLSMPYLAVNCGKKSVALNLKDPEGLERLKELAATADVFIEN